METADQPTAVVIPFRLPPSLAAIRRRWDRAAADGAPPHVTVLYPFLPFGELRSEVRDRLVDVTRQVEALDVLFTVVHVEPGLVWIEPRPAEPFVALTAAMTTRWPDYAPYEGRHTEVIPHLTVVNQPGAPVDTLSPTVARWVPFKAQPRRLELWRRGPTGRWRTHWRLDLGASR